MHTKSESPNLYSLMLEIEAINDKIKALRFKKSPDKITHVFSDDEEDTTVSYPQFSKTSPTSPQRKTLLTNKPNPCRDPVSTHDFFTMIRMQHKASMKTPQNSPQKKQQYGSAYSAIGPGK